MIDRTWWDPFGADLKSEVELYRASEPEEAVLLFMFDALTHYPEWVQALLLSYQETYGDSPMPVTRGLVQRHPIKETTE